MIRMLWLILVVGWSLTGTTAFAEELGKTRAALDGRKVASEETVIGNFVADAVREASGADIAVVQAMAFRANVTIDVGSVSEQQFRDGLASPSSKVTILKLTPALLKAVMQRAVSRLPNPNIAFLQVSGMTVTYDSRKPAGNRVESIQVGKKMLDLTDAKTTLTVAMPRELALGGAGYVLLFTDEITKTMETKEELTLISAITMAFEKAKDHTIHPKVDDRLKDLKPAEKSPVAPPAS